MGDRRPVVAAQCACRENGNGPLGARMKKRKRSKGKGSDKILLSPSTEALASQAAAADLVLPKTSVVESASSKQSITQSVTQSKTVSTGQSETAKRTGGVGLFAFVLVAVLFFASGFSSLIYQIVWTRMLVLVFGATTFATSTVLAIFMGGLALGSFVAGRFSDKVQRPLFWYGVLEAIIGFWALLTPLLFTAATPLYKFIWLHTHASILPFSLLRFLCTGLILIVPTTCMGATLPLLSRFVSDRLESIGSRVGTLYSANTLGAVVGALITGFVILPSVGIAASLWIGALINFFLLFAVLVAGRFHKSGAGSAVVSAGPRSSKARATTGKADAQRPSADSPSNAQDSEQSGPNNPIEQQSRLPWSVRLAIAAFACSGAIAMIYEVCWTRTLLMVIGSSTYAFTVMLSAFLIGIFLGSLICARVIDRTSKPFVWFGALQILIGLFTLISMREFNYLPYWNLSLNAKMHLDSNASMLLRFAVAGSVLVPTTLCLGAIFPAVVKGCVQNLSNVGRSVGDLYSANTVGAIVGAFLAGFVCLPMLGVEKTLIAAGLINIALGLMLLWTSQQLRNGPKIFATVLSAPLIIVFLQSPDIWDKKILLNVQSQRRSIRLVEAYAFPDFKDWKKDIDDNCLAKFWFDGPCSNVGIRFGTLSKVTSLVTNGHVDASDDVDMPIQALVSGFPLLLKPDAKDVAVIGWGCGQTVGTATLFPARSIVAVELEPAVIEASKFFHHVNHSPENDPRVHIQYNDGRNYLLATDEKFDIIVSEPSNPWQSGVCNLFTKEYFEICHARLQPGGILAVWVQTSEVPPSDLCGVLAGINQTFQHTLALDPRAGNLVVLASDSPLSIDMAAIRRLFKNKKLLDEFKKVGVSSAEDLAAHIAVSSNGMKSMVTSAYVNSDDRNRLEFDVGRSYEDRTYGPKNLAMLQSMSGNPSSQIIWGNVGNSEKARSLAAIAKEALDYAGDSVGLEWAEQSLALEPNAGAMATKGRVLAVQRHFLEARQEFEKALVLKPNDPELLMLRGSVLVGLKDRKNGIVDLQKSLALDPSNKLTRYLLAGCYNPQQFPAPGQQTKCANKVLQALGALPEDREFAGRWPHTYRLAGHAYFVLGDLARAKRYTAKYLLLQPNDKAAVSLMRILDKQ